MDPALFNVLPLLEEGAELIFFLRLKFSKVLIENFCFSNTKRKMNMNVLSRCLKCVYFYVFSVF